MPAGSSPPSLDRHPPVNLHPIPPALGPQRKVDDAKVDTLVGMGFDRKAAAEALEAAGGDEAAALERLLGGS